MTSTQADRKRPDVGNLDWHKSSHSGSQDNGCVEHAATPAGAHAVRDTKDRALGHVLFPATAWHTFVTAVRGDRL